MKRRNFLQLAAMAGLGVSLPISPRVVRAQSGAYPGPYWVQVNAGGGWDPTLLFNPVVDPLQSRTYTAAGSAAGIPYADITIDPLALGFDETQVGVEAYLMSPAAFLELYGSRLTVINGIDTSTNNHDAGSRAMWSGLLGEGYPSIGALVAATHAATKPMAYVSAGGYDTTAGLVPLTRVSSADTMKKLAAVNRIDPNNADNLDEFHTADTYARLRAAQMDRLSAMSGAQYLPKLRGAMSKLYAARESDWEISEIQVPAELIRFEGYNLGGLQSFAQQAQLAVAAFKSGLAASANLNMGGFDTHSNHDRDQTNRLAQLLYGIHFLMTEAATAGIDGQLVVAVAVVERAATEVGSDDDGAGKDHWPVTSMFAMGPGIAGGRVIGGTTADQRARLVIPESFEVVDGTDGTDGVMLKPEHVHHSLRALAGIDESLFPLAHDTLPLFG